MEFQLFNPPGGFFEIFKVMGVNVLLATFCGGLVGLERELKHKSAGLKTNMLICVGSTIFTTLSVLMAQSMAEKGYYGDPGRLAAQIVSGIGFLGAGAIMQSQAGMVLGLTTAATIWVVAALGVCIGMGYGLIAVVISLFVVSLIVGTTFFEGVVFGRSAMFSCEIMIEDPKGAVKEALNHALERNDLSLDDFDILSKGQDLSVLKIRVRGHRNDFKRFLLGLWQINGIREVKQD